MIFDSGKHWLIPMVMLKVKHWAGLIFISTGCFRQRIFYEMGNRVGIDVLKKYAALFGFGKTTGIDCWRNRGYYCEPKYKMKFLMRTGILRYL
jgi:penicillin-binding protein 2